MKNKTSIFIYTFLILGVCLMLSAGCKKDDDNTITDKDGNVYNTVTIGTQVWMKENLKTTKYSNGTAITNVTDSSEWSSITSGAWCYYNNDENNNATYGKLYNWYAVNTGNLCPTGWHVPSDTEWITLVRYLGEYDVVGGKLKESGLTHWNNPNVGATNISGFTGLPAGSRDEHGAFWSIGSNGSWWSSNVSSTNEAWYHYLYYNDGALRWSFSYFCWGYSIRCLKD